MGLAELYAEQIEKLWDWIADNKEFANEIKDLLIESLEREHLMVQLFTNDDENKSQIKKRVQHNINSKWNEVQNGLDPKDYENKLLP